MRKCNKPKTWISVITGFVVFFAIIFFAVSMRYDQWREENSEIPDAVSSISDGTTCRLTVVANSGAVREKEKFAEEVVEMCRNNSFRSLRLSTDMEGWPKKLDIRVYLTKRHIRERKPIMEILYEPEDDRDKCNIKSEREKYRMIIRSAR